MSSILYKYKKWTPFTKDIITSAQIYCATPNELNDPFDCKAEIFSSQFKMSIDEQVMSIHISSFFMFYLSSSATLISESEKKLIKKGMEKHKGDLKGLFNYINSYFDSTAPMAPKLSTGKDMIEAFEKKSSMLGVFSLTEVPNHMLMWAHYADQHKGIAIGFEKSKNNDLGNIDKCRQINYVTNFPKSDISLIQQKMIYSIGKEGKGTREIDMDINNPLVQQAFYQKAESWSYEKEWRLLEQKGGVRELPGKILEIIFGYNCPVETIKEVKGIAKEHIKNNVRFFKVGSKANSFELVLERL